MSAPTAQSTQRTGKLPAIQSASSSSGPATGEQPLSFTTTTRPDAALLASPTAASVPDPALKRIGKPVVGSRRIVDRATMEEGTASASMAVSTALAPAASAAPSLPAAALATAVPVLGPSAAAPASESMTAGVGIAEGETAPAVAVPLAAGAAGAACAACAAQQDASETAQGFDWATTSEFEERMRKQAKLKHFSTLCSEVAPGVFVGGITVARDLDTLRAAGITYIINCAGEVCPNYHETSGALRYSTLCLRDSKHERLDALFPMVLRWIRQELASGGRVLLHCYEGVSRSVTLAMLYIMWRTGTDFREALAHVREARGVAQPNLGFACQLMEWQRARQMVQAGQPLLFHVAPHAALAHCAAPHAALLPYLFIRPTDRKPARPHRAALLPTCGAVLVHRGHVWAWQGASCSDYETYAAALLLCARDLSIALHAPPPAESAFAAPLSSLLPPALPLQPSLPSALPSATPRTLDSVRLSIGDVAVAGAAAGADAGSSSAASSAASPSTSSSIAAVQVTGFAEQVRGASLAIAGLGPTMGSGLQLAAAPIVVLVAGQEDAAFAAALDSSTDAATAAAASAAALQDAAEQAALDALPSLYARPVEVRVPCAHAEGNAQAVPSPSPTATPTAYSSAGEPAAAVPEQYTPRATDMALDGALPTSPPPLSDVDDDADSDSDMPPHLAGVQPKLYQYPELHEALGVYDEHDLSSSDLFVLVLHPQDRHATSTLAYVWVGSGFEVPAGSADEDRSAFARAVGEQALAALGAPAEVADLGAQVRVVSEDSEPEDFWAAFEAGY